MNQICKECPVLQLVDGDRPKYKDGFQNGLFLQVIQGLSAEMTAAVKGTKAGLTDERIEEIRREEVESSGAGVEEATYLEENPQLAKAVHDCEVKIQLGECILHSVQPISKQ